MGELVQGVCVAFAIAMALLHLHLPLHRLPGAVQVPDPQRQLKTLLQKRRNALQISGAFPQRKSSFQMVDRLFKLSATDGDNSQ